MKFYNQLIIYNTYNGVNIIAVEAQPVEKDTAFTYKSYNSYIFVVCLVSRIPMYI